MQHPKRADQCCLSVLPSSHCSCGNPVRSPSHSVPVQPNAIYLPIEWIGCQPRRTASSFPHPVRVLAMRAAQHRSAVQHLRDNPFRLFSHHRRSLPTLGFVFLLGRRFLGGHVQRPYHQLYSSEIEHVGVYSTTSRAPRECTSAFSQSVRGMFP